MIFPGMDPYLEDARIWSGFHTPFIVYLRDRLQPLLRPRYVATVEERVYLEGPERRVSPDVSVQRNRPSNSGLVVALADADTAVMVQVPVLEIHEPLVAILDRQSGRRVVTVIELTSPTNKYAGPGRRSYLDKQTEVLNSETHLVEIDLQRTGPHVLAVPEWAARNHGPYDYLVSVNRARRSRETYELYPRRLAQRLPRIPVPLADPDADVIVDLQALVVQAYEAGAYRDRLNYDAPCVPPLSPEDQAWANQLIAAARQQPQPR